MYMPARRLFSTTSSRNSVLDYFKFFKPKNTTESSTPAPKDTTEVIKDLESNQEIITTKKIQILGRKNPRYTDKAIIKKNLNGFQIHSWTKKQTPVSQENYQDDINKHLTQIFQDFKIDITTKLDNLYLRFALLKSVQYHLSITIPDVQISKLDSFEKISDYLSNRSTLNPSIKNSNKSEFTPDAIDLNPADFIGTNVHISKFTFESEKQKAFKKLLKRASTLENESVKNFDKQ